MNLTKMKQVKRPYRFVGIQKGFMEIPDTELYDLLMDVPGHPAGSTVAKETLVKEGIWVG